MGTVGCCQGAWSALPGARPVRAPVPANFPASPCCSCAPFPSAGPSIPPASPLPPSLSHQGRGPALSPSPTWALCRTWAPPARRAPLLDDEAQGRDAPAEGKPPSALRRPSRSTVRSRALPGGSPAPSRWAPGTGTAGTCAPTSRASSPPRPPSRACALPLPRLRPRPAPPRPSCACAAPLPSAPPLPSSARGPPSLCVLVCLVPLISHSFVGLSPSFARTHELLLRLLSLIHQAVYVVRVFSVKK